MGLGLELRLYTFLASELPTVLRFYLPTLWSRARIVALAFSSSFSSFFSSFMYFFSSSSWHGSGKERRTL